jgi:ferredoxin
MGEALRIHVDRDLCIGSGLCLSTAPGHFELDQEGLARPLRAAALVLDVVAAAAELCPASAIFLTTVKASDTEDCDA